MLGFKAEDSWKMIGNMDFWTTVSGICGAIFNLQLCLVRFRPKFINLLKIAQSLASSQIRTTFYPYFL